MAITPFYSRRQTLEMLAAFPMLSSCGSEAEPAIGAMPVSSGTPDSTGLPTATPISERPRYHIAAPAGGWINDPQRPVRMGDRWTIWALFNPTYPTDGTEWRRWTSTDLVTWQDQGISIPRRTTSFGDIWTGSAVVDVTNTAGFGPGALIALVTMPADNAAGQNQSCALWYSLDEGASFTFHDIVLPNFPGNRQFRDPTVFWHETSGNWIMTLSEEGKIGIYTSPDLKHWTYSSGFLSTVVGGVMECSHLFKLHLYNPDGTTSADKWVLLVGGDGTASGFTGGTWYWVGEFDGTTFTASAPDGQWLDGGADFYAAVIWNDPQAADPIACAYSMGWMNNWAYANQLPATHDYRGQLSIVRELRLRLINNAPRLSSTPLPAQNKIFALTAQGSDQTIADGYDYIWPDNARMVAGRIDLTLNRIGSAWPSIVWLSVRGGSGYSTQICFELGNNRAFIRRVTSGPEAPDSEAWRLDRSLPCDFSEGVVDVSLFIDISSVELFVNNGEATLSQLINARIADASLNLTTVHGSVLVSKVSISSYI
ncbi:glycoside hydrolase family 32 protein [Sphingobium yanoikuyae]|nr:glycoside hydrolase family 32 protein [Sphingobium yanoikuyae]